MTGKRRIADRGGEIAAILPALDRRVTDCMMTLERVQIVAGRHHPAGAAREE